MATVCPGMSGHAPIDMVVRTFSGEERGPCLTIPANGGSRPESGKTEVMTSEPDAADLVLVDARQVIERTLWASGITGDKCAQLALRITGTLTEEGFSITRTHND